MCVNAHHIGQTQQDLETQAPPEKYLTWEMAVMGMKTGSAHAFRPNRISVREKKHKIHVPTPRSAVTKAAHESGDWNQFSRIYGASYRHGFSA